jgi:hypothetical protein
MRRFTALCAIALFSACGGDDGTAGGGVEVKFQISRGMELKDCSAVREVDAIKVTVFAQDGLSIYPGYPKAGDCATGSFSDPALPPGHYVVEILATGELGGDPRAVLYRARAEIDVPGSVAELSLAPEIGFLTISWSFETLDNLAPCEGEVGDVALYVSTEAAGRGSYQNLNLTCGDTPFMIPVPFLPQSYTVRLEAFSSETGRKLYNVLENRVLERGQNEPFHAIFQPIGGRLIFDYNFRVREAMIDDCNDARVGAQSVVINVRSPLGDEPLQKMISCTDQRPVILAGARYSQGQQLRLELVSEGVHRFRAEKPIVMPAGDADLRLISLDAVGSATVAFTLTSSSACNGGAAEAFDVALATVPGMQLLRGETLEASGRSLALSDVPYGEYAVAIIGRRGMTVLCQTAGRRTIDGRRNTWPPFEL